MNLSDTRWPTSTKSALHKNRILLSLELRARIAQRPDLAAPALCMQPHGRHILRSPNHRYHLTESALHARINERHQKRGPVTLSLRFRIQINRILDGETISRPWTILARICITNNSTPVFPHQVRQHHAHQLPPPLHPSPPL